jgi:hypothetical protein
MVSSVMLRRVAVVRADVSEEPSASLIRVTGIGELGTTLAVTSNGARCEEMFYFCVFRQHMRIQKILDEMVANIARI